MKKSSRITNTIKYFGISSATLLAAAPVVAPTVTSVLGWYGANSVFTAKSSKEAKADTGEVALGVLDRSGYSDYDKLFQNGVLIKQRTNPYIDAANFKTIDSDIQSQGSTPTLGKVGSHGVSANALDGIRMIARLTGGEGSLPGGVFLGGGMPNAEDFMHYLFTSTDGSKRASMEGLSGNLSRELELSKPVLGDKSKANDGQKIAEGVRYLSSYIDGKTVASVLGSAIFGNPNKATVKVLIDGQNGAATPQLATLLQEGTITITLVAQSGDYPDRTAQANIVLQNTSVLFKGARPLGVAAGTTTADFNNNLYKGNTLLSNTNDLSKNLPNLSTTSSGSTYVSYVPTGSVPKLQTGAPTLIGPAASSGFDFFKGYYSDWKGLQDSPTVDHKGNYHHTVVAIEWQDTDPDAENYINGKAARRELFGYKEDSDKQEVPVKNENVGAYATGSIVVPAGTSYNDIKNYIEKIKYVGTPSSQNYNPNIGVEDRFALAFDDVKAKPGNYKDYTWDTVFDRPEIKKNFSDKVGGNGTPATNWNNAVVTRSFSVDVPVYGNIKIPETATGVSGLFVAPKKEFIRGYGGSQDRVFARVNVVVYDKKWQNFTTGTKPSFLMLTKSGNSNEIYSVAYDDGATLNKNELPESFSSALNFKVNDSRFTNGTDSGFSAQKLATYVAEKFGQSVVNKDILISDEDKATSDKSVDLSNLAPDEDINNDHAKKYTIRSNAQGKNITVDASGVDISKAGSGTLKITYTNSKNEKGMGVESSTITVPYQVGVASQPVFYFVNGINQTITEGDQFNEMMFKVTPDQDAMDALVKSGKVYDKAPYVNDPNNTGLNVTLSGRVDTNKPGNYVLTYTAKNVQTGATTTLTRNITVLAKSDNSVASDYAVTELRSVGYINYVPGYGINVYNAPNGTFTGQRLKHGTAWKTFHQAISKKNPKDIWFEVGANQWIKGEYVSMTPVSSMLPLNEVGRVNYVPGYGIKVWSNPAEINWTGQYLAHGTDWKIFGEARGFYNLGGDQWVSKQYIQLVK